MLHRWSWRSPKGFSGKGDSSPFFLPRFFFLLLLLSPLQRHEPPLGNTSRHRQGHPSWWQRWWQCNTWLSCLGGLSIFTQWWSSSPTAQHVSGEEVACYSRSVLQSVLPFQCNAKPPYMVAIARIIYRTRLQQLLPWLLPPSLNFSTISSYFLSKYRDFQSFALIPSPKSCNYFYQVITITLGGVHMCDHAWPIECAWAQWVVIWVRTPSLPTTS